MAKWHVDRGKKVTGGIIHPYRKKKKFEMGSNPILTELGEEKKFIYKGRGNVKKVKLVKTKFINVTGPGKKHQKVEILDVLENSASPNYVRRGILTKGTVVKTELGKVRVTSRPSQDGVANGIKVEGK